jgi:polar amino acid transport system substrate-binding protein
MRTASSEGIHFSVASALLLAMALALALLPRPNASSLVNRLDAGYALRIGFALEAPYAFIDSDGELRGESIDLLRQSLEDLGIEHVRFIRVDFGELLQELEAGRIDVVAGGLFYTPERAQRALFTRPTAAVNTGLLVRGDAPRGERFRLALLEGSVEATYAESLIDGSFERIELADAAQALEALASGEVHGLALSVPSLRWMQRHRLATPNDFELRIAEGAPLGFPAYAVSRHEPGFARQLDDQLGRLIGTPQHLKLVEPYGFNSADVSRALAWVPQE